MVMLYTGSCKSVLSESSGDEMAADKYIDKQVDKLLAKMTLSEKIGQMVQVNDFDGVISDELRQKLREGKIGSMLNEIVPEANLEIQRIAIEESRLGIPLIMARDVIHGYRTIFPIPLAQAATWDPNLAQSCASCGERSILSRFSMDVRAYDGHST